jgi:hypothetical protein
MVFIRMLQLFQMKIKYFLSYFIRYIQGVILELILTIAFAFIMNMKHSIIYFIDDASNLKLIPTIGTDRLNLSFTNI